MSPRRVTLEHWRPVVGYEGFYEVSDLGRVRSVSRVTSHGRRRRAMPRKAAQRSTGYVVVVLSREGLRRQHSVHSLVLEAFVGPRPPGYEGCHENGIRSDNRPANLRWDTPKGNQADRALHGTRKLSPEAVDLIRAACVGRKHHDIAQQFGVSRSYVSMVGSGKR